MEGLILKTVRRIRKEIPRRLKNLRVMCDELIVQLSARENNGSDDVDTDADKYFEPLRAACESRVAKVMEIALDAIHILIERGYLRGSKRVYITPGAPADGSTSTSTASSVPPGGDDEYKQPKLTLMDLVIDTVSKCSDEFDDGVQLQVINSLLTAVTSPYCEVHEASLLLAVRACFHIHLITRNNVNRQTAKGALTQMLSAVFRRMEMMESSTSGGGRADGGGHGLTGGGADGGTGTSGSSSGGDFLSYNGAMYPEVYDSLGFRSSASGAAPTPLFDNSDLVTGIGSSGAGDVDGEGGAGKVHHHRNSILKRHQMAMEADAAEAAAVAAANTSVVSEQLAAVAASANANGGGSAAAAAVVAAATSAASASASATTSNLSFPSVHHKDAFLLFRALCKLSMKGLHDDSGTINDPIALQNKLLSLELILHVLQNGGNAFKTGDKFIYAIRNYLCVSLLGNCTSQVAEVTGLGLHIFVTLMEHFKDHLKNELEIFINSIFLKILESEYSTFDHKMKVLEVFHNIAKDPAGQVEIFVNYDCDFETNDLFQHIVDAFAKIAKNPNLPQSRAGTDFLTSSIRRFQAEEKSVRAMGLEGLVIILRSLLKSSGIAAPPTLKAVFSNTVNVANMLIADASSASSSLNPLVKQPHQQQQSTQSPRKSTQGGTGNSTPVPGGAEGAAATAAAAAEEAADDVGAIVNQPTAASALLLPVENFDRKQKILEEIDSGILKFNLNAKRGIQFLVSKGHIEYTPRDVANFFHVYKDRLDKSQVGEYLGKEREYENGFCLNVLHEYVDLMDFHKLPFGDAIRYFLSGFRIPGEAQKIDRIMEKFAERFYLQNRDVFASADMAFILAFSTIMLQTNLHNPAIKEDKRMTKEQFIKQNKGISADGELPESLLISIYENIAAKPISLNTDDAAAAGAGGNAKRGGGKESNIPFTVFSNDKRRKDAFHNERKEMVKAGEMMIKQSRKRAANSARSSMYVRTASLNPSAMGAAAAGAGGTPIAGGTTGGIEDAGALAMFGALGLQMGPGNNNSDEVYAKPMFEVSWAPMLGVFSQILETSDDPELVELCLTGFQYAIRLSARFPEFATARQSFINALSRFTMLETVKEMRLKNIECIRTLIYVALVDAEFLDESWYQILQCVSQLARLILIGNGLHDDGELIQVKPTHAANANASSAASSFFSMISGAGSGAGGASQAATTSPASSGNAASVRRNSIMTRTAGNSNSGGSNSGQSMGANAGGSSASSSLDPFKLFSAGPSKAESARFVEESNAMLLLSENIDEKLIDRIIANSQYLSSESVCHFIESMCEVSKFEITNDNRTVYAKESAESVSPRIFGLQKLVEVADYNMHLRHRVDWARMWSTLASHFATVGCHDNFYIAMYALDSLKQLSIKFLQKEELSNFNFQRLFLKPFEVIMTKSKSNDIRDIILNCLDVMIKTCAGNIRSGWRSIFSIFGVAVSCEKVEIAQYAFNITDRLLTTQFELLTHDFVEITNCLIAFVGCNHTSISLAALTHVEFCAHQLMEGKIQPPVDPLVAGAAAASVSGSVAVRARTVSGNQGDVLASGSADVPPASGSAAAPSSMIITEDASVFRLWWPLLLGLSTLVGDARYVVRSRALDTLQAILSDCGAIFSPTAWGVIFKGVLFPIMDSATLDFTPQPVSNYPRQNMGSNSSRDQDSWIGTTGLKVITTIIALFDDFKYHICCDLDDGVRVPLLSDILGMLEACVHQEVESLSRLGLLGLSSVVKIILPMVQDDDEEEDEEEDDDEDDDEEDEDYVLPRSSSGGNLQKSNTMSRPPRPAVGKGGNTPVNSSSTRQEKRRRIANKLLLQQQIADATGGSSTATGSSHRTAPASPEAIAKFHRDACGILCFRVSNVLLKSLCMDFGEAGKLHSVSIPDAHSEGGMKVIMTQCPVASRGEGAKKGFKQSSTSEADSLNTTLITMRKQQNSEVSRATSSDSTSGSALTSPAPGASEKSLPASSVEMKQEKAAAAAPSIVTVTTPYAKATVDPVTSYLPADSKLQVPARRAVDLCWGGRLYCSTDTFSTFTVDEQKLAGQQPNLAVEAAGSATSKGGVLRMAPSVAATPTTAAPAAAAPIKGKDAATAAKNSSAVNWRRLSSRAMVSMIVSLEAIEMLGDLLYDNYNAWDRTQLSAMVHALEVAHHHARAFNRNKELRMQLKLRHFMEFQDRIDRLPHLLDQEVQSLSQVLLVVLRLYQQPQTLSASQGLVSRSCMSTSERKQLAEEYVQRLCPYTCDMYMHFDTLCLSSSASSSSSSLTSDSYQFVAEQLEAYAAPLSIVLQSVAHFNPTVEFTRNLSWLVPHLTRLVLCNSRPMRKLVATVYEKLMNPYILSLSHLPQPPAPTNSK